MLKGTDYVTCFCDSCGARREVPTYYDGATGSQMVKLPKSWGVYAQKNSGWRKTVFCRRCNENYKRGLLKWKS